MDGLDNKIEKTEEISSDIEYRERLITKCEKHRENKVEKYVEPLGLQQKI